VFGPPDGLSASELPTLNASDAESSVCAQLRRYSYIGTGIWFVLKRVVRQLTVASSRRRNTTLAYEGMRDWWASIVHAHSSRARVTFSACPPVAEGHAERQPRDRHRQVPRARLPVLLLLLLLLLLGQLPGRRSAAGRLRAHITVVRTARKVAGVRLLLLPAAGLSRGAPRAVPHADRRPVFPAGCHAVQIPIEGSICRRCCRRSAAGVGQEEPSVLLIALELRLLPLLLLLLLAVLRGGRVVAASAAQRGAQQSGGGHAAAVLRAGQLEADALAAGLVHVRRHHAHQLDLHSGMILLYIRVFRYSSSAQSPMASA